MADCVVPTRDIVLEYRGIKQNIETGELDSRFVPQFGFNVCELARLTEQEPGDSTFILDEGDVDRLAETNFGRVFLSFYFSDVMDVEDIYRSGVLHFQDLEDSDAAIEARAKMLVKMMPEAVEEVITELGLETLDRGKVARSFHILISKNLCGNLSFNGCAEYEAKDRSGKAVMLGTIQLEPEAVMDRSETGLKGLLKHELVHHLIHHIRAKNGFGTTVEGWLSEGMATELAGSPGQPWRYEGRRLFYAGSFDELDYDRILLYDRHSGYLKAGLAVRYIKNVGGPCAMKKIVARMAGGDSAREAIEKTLGIGWKEFREHADAYIEDQIARKLDRRPSWRFGFGAPLTDELDLPTISAGADIFTPLEKLGLGLETFLRYQREVDDDAADERWITHQFHGGVALTSPYLFPQSGRGIPIFGRLKSREWDFSLLAAAISAGPSLNLVTHQQAGEKVVRMGHELTPWKTVGHETRPDIVVGGALYLAEVNLTSHTSCRLGLEHLKEVFGGRDGTYLTLDLGMQF